MTNIDTILSVSAREYAEEKLSTSLYREDDFVFSDKFEKKMKKMMKSEYNCYHRMTLTRTRRFLSAAAIVSVVLLASLSVGAVRDTIANFFVHTFDGHDTIAVPSSNARYPEKIEKWYELSALPKEYKLIEEDVSGDSALLTYSDGEDEFNFDQYIKAGYEADIDSENSENTEEIYNGIKYLVSVMETEQGDSVDVVWDNGEYVFMASGSFPKDKMLEICDSIKTVERSD